MSTNKAFEKLSAETIKQFNKLASLESTSIWRSSFVQIALAAIGFMHMAFLSIWSIAWLISVLPWPSIK